MGTSISVFNKKLLIDPERIINNYEMKYGIKGEYMNCYNIKQESRFQIRLLIQHHMHCFSYGNRNEHYVYDEHENNYVVINANAVTISKISGYYKKVAINIYQLYVYSYLWLY